MIDMRKKLKSTICKLECAASNGNRYPPYPQVMATAISQKWLHLFQVICQQTHSHLKMP